MTCTKTMNHKTCWFSSQRLYLRNLVNSDCQIIYTYRNDVRINFFQSFKETSYASILTMVQTNSHNQSLCLSEAVFGICLKLNDAFIGELYCDYDATNVVLLLGYTIILSYQNQGYAYEILTALLAYLRYEKKPLIIRCFVYEKNYFSRKLLHKLAFGLPNKVAYEYDKIKGVILLYEKIIT